MNSKKEIKLTWEKGTVLQDAGDIVTLAGIDFVDLKELGPSGDGQGDHDPIVVAFKG